MNMSNGKLFIQRQIIYTTCVRTLSTNKLSVHQKNNEERFVTLLLYLVTSPTSTAIDKIQKIILTKEGDIQIYNNHRLACFSFYG